MTNHEIEQIYTVDEVANRFKVTNQSVRRWLLQGKLTAFRIGDNVRITEASIQQFLEDSNKLAKKGE